MTTQSALSVALVGFVLAGLAFTGVWLRRRGGRLLPRRRPWRVRWGWPEVILAVVTMVAVPAAVYAGLTVAGVFRAYYGDTPTDPASDLFQRCAVLWAQTAALPVQVALTLALVWFVSGTRPRDLGLRRHRLLPGLAAGVAVWVLVAPPVFGLHYLTIFAQKWAFGWEPKEHALVRLLAAEGRPAEWVLLVLQAVVFAPLWEELLFRGLLLPRLARHEWAAHAVWAVAAVFVVPTSRAVTWASAAPLLFVLALWAAGTAATVREAGPVWAWRAVLSSATLFAAVHADAWPAPVPLFVLAVALGRLALRTRSLVAPILLHALFNAVSTLMLLLGYS